MLGTSTAISSNTINLDIEIILVSTHVYGNLRFRALLLFGPFIHTIVNTVVTWLSYTNIKPVFIV